MFLCFRLQRDIRDFEEEQSILLFLYISNHEKKNLSEMTYVTNAPVLQSHQSCLRALLKPLENPRVCQGMKFTDVCSVKLNSLQDAVKALLWLKARPPRHRRARPWPATSRGKRGRSVEQTSWHRG